jgi:hypothetical protein
MKWDNFVTLCKQEPGECSPVITRLRAGYLRNFGCIPGKGKRFISFPEHTQQHWSPSSLLFSVFCMGFVAEVK